MRARWVALFLLPTMVCGCTLLASLQEHRSAVDAVVDAASDGEVDAPFDGPLDAAVDEGPPQMTRGCAERDATFCDDFDDGGGLANWGSFPGAGTIALFDAGLGMIPLSRPNSLAVSVPSVPVGGRETSKVQRAFPSGSRRARLAVNVRNVPDKAEVTLFAINMGGGKFVGLRAIGTPGGVTLRVDIETISSTPLSAFLLRSRWHDIGLELRFPDGGAGTLITSVDGVEEVFALPIVPTTFVVELGLLVSEAAGSTVAIDDVTVD